MVKMWRRVPDPTFLDPRDRVRPLTHPQGRTYNHHRPLLDRLHRMLPGIVVRPAKRPDPSAEALGSDFRPDRPYRGSQPKTMRTSPTVDR